MRCNPRAGRYKAGRLRVADRRCGHGITRSLPSLGKGGTEKAECPDALTRRYAAAWAAALAPAMRPQVMALEMVNPMNAELQLVSPAQ